MARKERSASVNISVGEFFSSPLADAAYYDRLAKICGRHHLVLQAFSLIAAVVFFALLFIDSPYRTYVFAVQMTTLAIALAFSLAAYRLQRKVVRIIDALIEGGDDE